MANTFSGYIRRIDFEPKMSYLGFRTYAHVFLEDKPNGKKVDVYTEDFRFEAALLTNFDPSSPLPPKVEIQYEEVDKAKKIVRVIMDREFNKLPGAMTVHGKHSTSITRKRRKG